MAKSKTNPEAIYMQLKALLLQQPEYGSPASPEKMQWLGRAAAIIEPLLDTFDHTEFKTAMDKYISYGSKSEDTLNSYWKIQTILYRALAKSELSPGQHPLFTPIGSMLNNLYERLAWEHVKLQRLSDYFRLPILVAPEVEK